MIRENLKQAQIDAMKAKEKERLAAIRLILAKVKDRDIELRTGEAPSDDDALVTDVLIKMAKQRRESIDMYRQGGRDELADAEAAELAVIEEFLPAQLDEAETRAAVKAVAQEIGATSPADMGKLMGQLKARHGQSIDMGLAGKIAKETLA